MGVVENFPYTNFHDLNLDWILKNISEQNETLAKFISQNVLSYADPFEWDITSQYPKNTVVVDPQTGIVYMSKTPVPQGIEITNTDYWLPIFDYNKYPIYNEVTEDILFRGNVVTSDVIEGGDTHFL